MMRIMLALLIWSLAHRRHPRHGSPPTACCPTGDPKGVMITHAAVCSALATTINFMKASGVTFGPGDRILSYLPLAHIFDRLNEEAFLYLGAAIGYFQGA